MATTQDNIKDSKLAASSKKKNVKEKIENWLKDSKGFDELDIYRSAIKSRNEVTTF